MDQSQYDDEVFFAKYSQMDRSQKGLAGAGEWETFKRLLPDFRGKRVLDLGCGFGWHCRYALEQGAASVIGVDASRKMLEEAEHKTSSPQIRYIHSGIEEVEFPPGAFDIVLSSLAFHYLNSFGDVARKTRCWLAAGGDFVFSVEHPVFTAYGTQDWIYGGEGNILHFPVDRYFIEGPRQTSFLGEKVKKHHKTLTTYLSALLGNGFIISGLEEPQPPVWMIDAVPGMENELRRPMMLIISAKAAGGKAAD